MPSESETAELVRKANNLRKIPLAILPPDDPFRQIVEREEARLRALAKMAVREKRYGAVNNAE